MLQIHHRGVAATLCLLAALGCKKVETQALALLPTVKVAEATARDVPIYAEAIGQTRGNSEIEISARVEGFLETVNFREGSIVKKGQLLYTIDSRPFKADLAQAKADLARAQAELVRTQQDVSRYEPLVAKHAVSVQEFETAKSQAQAQHAAVAASQAKLERAQIELGYTTITAPDDGIVGTTAAYPGTLVGRGLSTLTHLSKVDPIHVRFNISERDYLYYARSHETRRAPSGKAAAGGSALGGSAEFQLVLADGSVHPHSGSLVFVDRNIDAKTGTILLEAAFPNPGGLIRPGQYARVRAAVSIKQNAVIVPQGAVQDIQGVSNVAVIGADDTVQVRMIKPAERIGALVVVDSGLKAGERIVVEGVQKIRPGMKVKVQEVPLEEPVTVNTDAPGH
jgi:membrane fusion protein (multidrug efflux system)